jgi:hypothetical protein
MNGGNDFSTEPTATSADSFSTNQIGDTPQFIGGGIEKPKSPENQDQEKSSVLDFGKLLIQKLN